MSIYSNVTEEDLINLRKLANQEKNQQAPKIKKRISKQTHDVKLAESLSTITTKLDETSKNLGDVIKESTQKLRNVIKESQPQTPQLALETSQPQLPIENNQDDTQPGVLYDASPENTLTKMKNKQKGFFKIREDKDGQRYWNGIPIQTPRDSIVEVKGKKLNITTNLQNVFSDTTDESLKKKDKTENRTYKKLLQTLDYENYKPKYGENKAGRYKNTKIILNPFDLQGQGIEKNIIPSNIIAIHNRLEVLLGLKFSGHTDTLTEASNLLDELYKRGEIQNEQQYRNAINNFSSP